MESKLKEQEVFETIAVKFLLALSPEESKGIRLCQYMIKAFYYYVDEVLKLKNIDAYPNIKEDFFKKLNHYVGIKLPPNSEELMEQYERNVPKCGAITFNPEGTKVLVISFKGKYSFPKGKIDEEEHPEGCASREVFQETGIRILNNIVPGSRMEFSSRFSNHSVFYVAKGVREDEPIVIDRREVDKAFWMPLSEFNRLIGTRHFSLLSKEVWRIYNARFCTKPTDFQTFLELNRGKKCSLRQDEGNPLLSFKFDMSQIRNSLITSK